MTKQNRTPAQEVGFLFFLSCVALITGAACGILMRIILHITQ